MKRVLLLVVLFASATAPAALADGWYVPASGAAGLAQEYRGEAGNRFLVLSASCKGIGKSLPSTYPKSQEGVDHSRRFASYLCELTTDKGLLEYKVQFTQNDRTCKSGFCVHYTAVETGKEPVWVPPAGFTRWDRIGSGKGVVGVRPTRCPSSQAGSSNGVCWAFLMVSQKACPHGISARVKIVKDGKVVGSGNDRETAPAGEQVLEHGVIPGRHPGVTLRLAVVNCS